MKIAFIGGSGHFYLSALSARDDVQRAAAGDEYAQARFADSGATWFDDPRDMLDRFKPDVVNIGAIPGHNGDWVAAVLERDIPIVTDKPVAATWAQLEYVAALCEANPKRIVVTEFPLRCYPAFAAARQAVRDGAIGQVVLATGQKSYRFGNQRPPWYAKRELYGGSILFAASHAIDFIHYVTGLDYLDVRAGHANLSKPDYHDFEEVTATLFTLATGAPAIVHTDYNRPAKAPTHGDDRLRVVGSKGVVEVRDERCVLMTHDDEPRDITDTAAPPTPHDAMLAAALGEPSDLFTTAQSLKIARICLHARDAADSGETVQIGG
jgi:predicted dehydrogenase